MTDAQHDPSAADPRSNPWCVWWSDPPPSGLSLLLWYPTPGSVFQEIIDSKVEVAYKDEEEVYPKARELTKRFDRPDVNANEFRDALKDLIDANYVWAGTFDELRRADNENTARIVDEFLERHAEEHDVDYDGQVRAITDEEVDPFADLLHDYKS